MVLFVDVVDKPSDLLGNSGVTEVVMSSVTDIGSAQAHSSMEGHGVIDWDSLDVIPILEEHIGATVTLMDVDAMYEFLGLAAKDERAQQEKMDAEQEGDEDIDLQGAELPVDDLIPVDDVIGYDKEDPPMDVGTIYPCMNEFRVAVRHNAIKG